MTCFVQLHFLTVYSISNPNRDDMGRPKSAMYGGVHRLRMSSQSLKRAARISPAMSDALKGNMGERTQRLGDELFKHLRDEMGASDQKARSISKDVAQVFGKLDAAAEKKNPDHVRIRQLAFISPYERQAAMEMAERAYAGETLERSSKTRGKAILRTADGAVDIAEKILRKFDGAVDLAMFGRMLADAPKFNREAAVQVSHAITTHRADVEDDYYTAADDLKSPSEDMGAGFVGEAGFGSGVYYLYVCIDTKRLLKNLDGDSDLARRALEAVTEAFATASPSGKRNSFAHHTRASFIRAEAGDQQPRSLAAAFLKPVEGENLLKESIGKLRKTAELIDKAYGPTADSLIEMDVLGGTGTLADVKTFVSGQLVDA
ncbi:MAG: type I-E CRISPR-associated protein Cas7/Cse4/CasC [Rhodobacteraceae bacterium]|nr:type I-E CRISPR-associated protein Cas7/Cse4/CasC [Paracoccaceae bacterium]